MGTRLEFQDLLEILLGGSSVYFQPPANIDMQYPAIVYNRDYQSNQFADNLPYYRRIRYQVTVMDPDPDSLIPGKIGALPLTAFDRHFTVGNLNHDVYNVYF